MTARARKALKAIRRCVREGHYVLLPHFRERMAQRGLFWPDVRLILDEPTDVREGGLEILGRPQWIVAGMAVDDRPIEIVCVLAQDDRGVLTLFITVYEVQLGNKAKTESTTREYDVEA